MAGLLRSLRLYAVPIGILVLVWLSNVKGWIDAGLDLLPFVVDPAPWSRSITMLVLVGAPFWRFHLMVRERDSAFRDHRWSTDQLEDANAYLDHTIALLESRIAWIRGAADPLKVGSAGSSNPAKSEFELLLEWADETYACCCELLGEVAGGRVWRASDFEVHRYENSPDKTARLLQDVAEARFWISRLQQDLEFERRRVEPLEQIEALTVVRKKPA